MLQILMKLCVLLTSIILLGSDPAEEMQRQLRIQLPDIKVEEGGPDITYFPSGEIVVDTAIPDLDGVSTNEFKYFGSYGRAPILKIDSETKKILIRVRGDVASVFYDTWNFGISAASDSQNLTLEIDNPYGFIFHNFTNVGQELLLKSSLKVALEENFQSTHPVSIYAPRVNTYGEIIGASKMAIHGDLFENEGVIEAKTNFLLNLTQPWENRGWIRAPVIRLDVPKIRNFPGKDVGIIAQGNTSEKPLLQIATGTLENYGNLLSEGFLNIDAAGKIANSGVLESLHHMKLTGTEVFNGKNIAVQGNLRVEGPNGQLSKIIDNASGDMRASKALMLRAAKIFNRPAIDDNEKALGKIEDIQIKQIGSESAIRFLSKDGLSAVEKRKSQIPELNLASHISSGGDFKIEGGEFDNLVSHIQVGGDAIFDPLTSPAYNQESLTLWEKRDLVISDAIDGSLAAGLGQNAGTIIFCTLNPFCWVGATVSAIAGAEWTSETYDFMTKDGRKFIEYEVGGVQKICHGKGHDNEKEKLFRCEDTYTAKPASMQVNGAVRGNPARWTQHNYKQGEGYAWLKEEKPLTADDFHVNVQDQVVLPDLTAISANRHLYQELTYYPSKVPEHPLPMQYLWQDILKGGSNHHDGGIAQLLSFYSPDPNAKALMAMSPSIESRVVETLLYKAIGPNNLNIQNLIERSQSLIRQWQLPLGTMPSDERIEALKSPIILPVFSQLKLDGMETQMLIPAIIFDKVTIQKARQQKSNIVRGNIIDLKVTGDMVVQGALESVGGHLKAYAKNLSVNGELRSASDIDLVADSNLLVRTMAAEISGSMSSKPTSIFAGGKIKMHAREKFEAQGIEVKGDDIHVSSDGDLVVIPVKVVQKYKEEIITSFNETRRIEFCESFISNNWQSLGKMNLEAVGDLKVSGGKFKAKDVIDLKSTEGSISNEKLQKICKKEFSSVDKGLWAWFFGKEESTTETDISHEGTSFESETANVNVDAKNDIKFHDATLQAYSGKINLDAGRHINITNSIDTHELETYFKQNNFFSRAKDGRFYILGSSGERIYIRQDQLHAAYFSAKNIKMTAGGEAHTYGGRFFGQNSFSLNATHGVYDHAVRLLDENKTHVFESGWSVGGTLNEGEQSVETGIGFKTGTQKNTTDAATGSHFVAPKIDVSSTDGDVELEATQLLGSTFLGGKNVRVRAAVAELCFENTSLEAFIGLKLGIKTNLLAAMAHAIERAPDDVEVWEDGVNLGFSLLQSGMEIATGILLPVEGGLWLTASAEYQASEQCLQMAIAPRIVGRDIKVYGTEEVIFVGAKLKGKTGSIRAKNLRVESQELHGKSSSTTVKGKVDVMLQGGGTSTIQAEASHKGTKSTTHAHSTLEFEDELKFDVSELAIFKGANVTAGKLIGNFGDLLVESVKSELEVSGGGAKLSFNPDALKDIAKFLTGGGASFETRKKTWVEDVTQLVGLDVAKIVVHKTLELTGAIIANAQRYPNGTLSENGNLELETAKLVLNDIETADDGLLFGVEASVSKMKGMLGTVQGELGYTNLDGRVNATLGLGNVKVNGTLIDDDHEGLNRNITDVYEESGVDIKPIHFYIPVPDFKHPEDIKSFFDEIYEGIRHPGMRVHNSFNRILRGMDWVFDDAQNRFPDMEPENLKLMKFYKVVGDKIREEVNKDFAEEEAKYEDARRQAEDSGDEAGAERAEAAQQMLEKAKNDAREGRLRGMAAESDSDFSDEERTKFAIQHRMKESASKAARSRAEAMEKSEMSADDFVLDQGAELLYEAQKFGDLPVGNLRQALEALNESVSDGDAEKTDRLVNDFYTATIAVLGFVPVVGVAAGLQDFIDAMKGYDINNAELGSAERSLLMLAAAGSVFGLRNEIKGAAAGVKGASGLYKIFKTGDAAGDLGRAGKTILKPLGKGSTGRFLPNNLKEKLAMEQAISHAIDGKRVALPRGMTDPRWPGSEGWEKMAQNINGIEIHYVFNRATGHMDDFKFVNLGKSK